MTASVTLPFHPLAEIFPLIEGEEFGALVASIKSRGLLERIVMHEGMILDGRNRYRACLVAEIDPEFVDFCGDDALAFVVDTNLHRRHLTTSQRAMIAAELGRLGWGGDRSKPSNEGLSTEARAAALKVGRASVERAEAVVDHGSAELKEAVRQGKATVAAAAEIALRPEAEQREIVAQGRDEILKAAKKFRAEDQAKKAERRTEREAALGAKIAALPDKKYGVVLADPEWCFEPWSRETGMDRAADNHYPTSCTDVIAARDVPSIAADDCVLFLWATAPMLPHALVVMAAWGFNYVSNYVWAKDRIGTGYWNRNKHEHLLVGTKGKKIPAPAMGTQWESLISAPVGEHSAKPECFHEMIEFYYPTLPKIELNARRARPGWEAWGYEAPLPPHDPETGEIIETVAGDPPNAGDAEPAPAAASPGVGSPSDTDGLEIPAFLRRLPDNSLPEAPP
jgi:N6-adenosine-specific RNA methylase IME4